MILMLVYGQLYYFLEGNVRKAKHQTGGNHPHFLCMVIWNYNHVVIFGVDIDQIGVKQPWSIDCF